MVNTASHPWRGRAVVLRSTFLLLLLVLAVLHSVEANPTPRSSSSSSSTSHGDEDKKKAAADKKAGVGSKGASNALAADPTAHDGPEPGSAAERVARMLSDPEYGQDTYATAESPFGAVPREMWAGESLEEAVQRWRDPATGAEAKFIERERAQRIEGARIEAEHRAAASAPKVAGATPDATPAKTTGDDNAQLRQDQQRAEAPAAVANDGSAAAEAGEPYIPGAPMTTASPDGEPLQEIQIELTGGSEEEVVDALRTLLDGAGAVPGGTAAPIGAGESSAAVDQGQPLPPGEIALPGGDGEQKESTMIINGVEIKLKGPVSFSMGPDGFKTIGGATSFTMVNGQVVGQLPEAQPLSTARIPPLDEEPLESGIIEDSIDDQLLQAARHADPLRPSEVEELTASRPPPPPPPAATEKEDANDKGAASDDDAVPLTAVAGSIDVARGNLQRFRREREQPAERSATRKLANVLRTRFGVDLSAASPSDSATPKGSKEPKTTTTAPLPSEVSRVLCRALCGFGAANASVASGRVLEADLLLVIGLQTGPAVAVDSSGSTTAAAVNPSKVNPSHLRTFLEQRVHESGCGDGDSTSLARCPTRSNVLLLHAALKSSGAVVEFDPVGAVPLLRAALEQSRSDRHAGPADAPDVDEHTLAAIRRHATSVHLDAAQRLSTRWERGVDVPYRSCSAALYTRLLAAEAAYLPSTSSPAAAMKKNGKRDSMATSRFYTTMWLNPPRALDQPPFMSGETLAFLEEFSEGRGSVSGYTPSTPVEASDFVRRISRASDVAVGSKFWGGRNGGGSDAGTKQSVVRELWPHGTKYQEMDDPSGRRTTRSPLAAGSVSRLGRGYRALGAGLRFENGEAAFAAGMEPSAGEQQDAHQQHQPKSSGERWVAAAARAFVSAIGDSSYESLVALGRLYLTSHVHANEVAVPSTGSNATLALRFFRLALDFRRRQRTRQLRDRAFETIASLRSKPSSKASGGGALTSSKIPSSANEALFGIAAALAAGAESREIQSEAHRRGLVARYLNASAFCGNGHAAYSLALLLDEGFVSVRTLMKATAAPTQSESETQQGNVDASPTAPPAEATTPTADRKEDSPQNPTTTSPPRRASSSTLRRASAAATTSTPLVAWWGYTLQRGGASNRTQRAARTGLRDHLTEDSQVAGQTGSRAARVRGWTLSDHVGALMELAEVAGDWRAATWRARQQFNTAVRAAGASSPLGGPQLTHATEYGWFVGVRISRSASAYAPSLSHRAVGLDVGRTDLARNITRQQSLSSGSGRFDIDVLVARHVQPPNCLQHLRILTRALQNDWPVVTPKDQELPRYLSDVAFSGRSKPRLVSDALQRLGTVKIHLASRLVDGEHVDEASSARALPARAARLARVDGRKAAAVEQREGSGKYAVVGRQLSRWSRGMHRAIDDAVQEAAIRSARWGLLRTWADAVPSLAAGIADQCGDLQALAATSKVDPLVACGVVSPPHSPVAGFVYQATGSPALLPEPGTHDDAAYAAAVVALVGQHETSGAYVSLDAAVALLVPAKEFYESPLGAPDTAGSARTTYYDGVMDAADDGSRGVLPSAVAAVGGFVFDWCRAVIYHPAVRLAIAVLHTMETLIAGPQLRVLQPITTMSSTEEASAATTGEQPLLLYRSAETPQHVARWLSEQRVAHAQGASLFGLGRDPSRDSPSDASYSVMEAGELLGSTDHDDYMRSVEPMRTQPYDATNAWRRRLARVGHHRALADTAAEPTLQDGTRNPRNVAAAFASYVECGLAPRGFLVDPHCLIEAARLLASADVVGGQDPSASGATASSNGASFTAPPVTKLRRSPWLNLTTAFYILDTSARRYGGAALARSIPFLSAVQRSVRVVEARHDARVKAMNGPTGGANRRGRNALRRMAISAAFGPLDSALTDPVHVPPSPSTPSATPSRASKKYELQKQALVVRATVVQALLLKALGVLQHVQAIAAKQDAELNDIFSEDEEEDEMWRDEVSGSKSSSAAQALQWIARDERAGYDSLLGGAIKHRASRPSNRGALDAAVFISKYSIFYRSRDTRWLVRTLAATTRSNPDGHRLPADLPPLFTALVDTARAVTQRALLLQQRRSFRSGPPVRGGGDQLAFATVEAVIGGVAGAKYWRTAPAPWLCLSDGYLDALRCAHHVLRDPQLAHAMLINITHPRVITPAAALSARLHRNQRGPDSPSYHFDTILNRQHARALERSKAGTSGQPTTQQGGSGHPGRPGANRNPGRRRTNGG